MRLRLCVTLCAISFLFHAAMAEDDCDNPPQCGTCAEPRTPKPDCTDPGGCECKSGNSGGGQCEWEGGAVCTGYGSCITPQEPTCHDGVCTDSCDEDASCKYGYSTPVLMHRCAVTCKVVPFVSCSCITSGGSGAPLATNARYTPCR